MVGKRPILPATLLVALVLAGAVYAWAWNVRAVQFRGCVCNLAALCQAKEVATMDGKWVGKVTLPMGFLAGPGRFLSVVPRCPAGGTYRVQVLGVLPTCSIPGHVLTDEIYGRFDPVDFARVLPVVNGIAQLSMPE